MSARNQDPGERLEAVLDAISFAARRIARTDSWEEVADEVLERLGLAVGASRAYIFQNVLAQDGELLQDERFEWVAPGASTTIDDPDNHHWPYARGEGRFAETLAAGEVVHGLASTFSPEERASLVEEDILSTAFVPVFVAGEWWGYLGFDDCVEERTWSEADIKVLRTVAETLGAAVEREARDKGYRETEAKYRTLIENIPAVTYLETPGADFTESYAEFYVSPQVEQLVGYTPEEWLADGGMWVDIVHPDDREALLEEAERTARSGEPYRAEYRMLHRDGHVVWVHDEAELVFDEEGKPKYWHGVMTDITERKRAEEESASTEAKYRVLVENIPAIPYAEVIGGEVDTSYVGPQIEPMLGITQEAFLDDDNEIFTDHVHPDDIGWVTAEYEEAKRRGGPVKQEYRVLRDDGRVVWLRDEFTVTLDDSGQPARIEGVMFDITDQKVAEERRREAEAKYRILVEHIPAIPYADLAGESMSSMYVGPQIESILGITTERWAEVENDVWLEVLHPDDRERAHSEYMAAQRQGGSFTQIYRLIRPDDGRVVWIRDDFTVLLKEDGSPDVIQGVMYDVTEQKHAEEELREAQEKYQTLIEQLPAITYIDPVNENEMSMYVSPQVEELLGCAPEKWLSDSSWWHDHVHPEDEPRVWETYVQHRESGEPLVQEYRMVRDDERVVWIREQAALLRNEDGDPWVIQGLMYDITERKEAEEQIAFLAYHDKLTGLANRAMFEEMLEPALARARRHNLSVGVLFMDLDNFKQVNDSLGHDRGDLLLQQVADRLREAVRDEDLVARQGGDEFLVLISDVEPEEAEEDFLLEKDRAVKISELMAERIHRKMRAPFVLGDDEISTSMSVGISVFPLDAADGRQLLKNADAAMYESKKLRSGGSVVHAHAGGDPLTQLSFTKRLRRAVQDQRWVLHYQPMVDLSDGRIIGVEALLRWRKPKGDLVPPNEFLPLAEEMGLLEIIGEWVVEELCRQGNAWRKRGIDLDLSFNLSPRQLWQRNLAEKLGSSLRGAGLDPGRVTVEIAESTAVTDPARTQRVLWALHEVGLKLAIDDFGTGYSPPARLKHLPVDVLKIDQPLTRDLPDDADVGGFVQAVVRFAEGLGVASLAEGIETEEQRRWLVDKGCKLGQGYLFSRPVSADQIVELIRRTGGKLTPSQG